MSKDNSSNHWILNAALIGSTAIATTLSVYFYQQVKKTESKLQKEISNRKEERIGRVRAEQKNRDLEHKVLNLQQKLANSSPSLLLENNSSNNESNEIISKASINEGSENISQFPFLPIQPIGYLRSVYKTRNGCPRQPYYVTKGRAILKLLPHCNPSSSLDGLEQYSHCYIIFQFNLNTNLTKGVLTDSQNAIKAKIKPPRLGNKKVGIYATRTPHRYNAIGLSIVEIDHIDRDGTLFLKGTDILDGTAVLDIKPYIDGYDNFSNVKVPEWIKEPLESVEKYQVTFSDEAKRQLIEDVTHLEFFDKRSELDEFIEFLTQVLSYDIRSHIKKARSVDRQDEHELLVDKVKVTFVVDASSKVNHVIKIENA
ncbi:hypothetical protein C9374_003435 [Naegleria lovaniensis]|uniref:TsaA-like domain-containing protein n=1 Tax=Naegleria lovaniensis TaxID=51637 RepID=A0AA88GRN5_NAELO|nr:uncharacterized protein C9374_003435 [Naegleria lovaniensis]KAG2385620.1 hypothetical protein C9374_003435 [Naegleria lovaniensis]